MGGKVGDCIECEVQKFGVGIFCCVGMLFVVFVDDWNLVFVDLVDYVVQKLVMFWYGQEKFCNVVCYQVEIVGVGWNVDVCELVQQVVEEC